MSIRLTKIVVDVLAGTTITEACQSAMDKKLELQCHVYFRFNGCALNTRRGYSGMLARYYKYINKKGRQYGNTPRNTI